MPPCVAPPPATIAARAAQIGPSWARNPAAAAHGAKCFSLLRDPVCSSSNPPPPVRLQQPAQSPCTTTTNRSELASYARPGLSLAAEKFGVAGDRMSRSPELLTPLQSLPSATLIVGRQI
ncbi:hypothetical protein ZWY2020_007829 [Hordeum vulgare]|nr:hypothetical protein ZWY2020_007829 [Hordeum vulgare]